MKKTPLLLFGLILLPMLILGWLSARLEQNQRVLFKHQFEGLIEVQLAEIDQRFQTHFRNLEKALNAETLALHQTKAPLYPLAALKQLSKTSPYIEQVFLLDSLGNTVFPASHTNNYLEQDFLQATENLRNTPSLFTLLPNESGTVAQAKTVTKATEKSASSFSARLRSAPAQREIALISKAQYAAKAATGADTQGADTSAGQKPQPASAISAHASAVFSSSGWLAWFNNSQLQHIYWRKDQDGNILGFAINSARLLSDLINLLPDESAANNQALHNAQISLLNSRGETSYEWGSLKSRQAQEKPQKIFPLSHPLGSWRLEYHSPGLENPRSHWLEKIVLIAITLLALSVIAWLIYRENTRSIRLAEQRVNFVNQVSHELKTPLTNVRMYAELLEKQLDNEASKPRRYLAIISNESQRLSRLIDNVLNFSRLGRNRVELNLSAGTLGTSLNKVIAAFAPSFSQQGLSIQLDDQCPDTVMLDAECLEQILNNLLSNCEKYAPQSGPVKISCWQENDFSFVQVTDNGPGIAPEQAEKIFTPFYRVSNKLTDGISGTGIGLSIARDMARKHGGDLQLVTATAGASFILSLHTPAIATNENCR
ncbi:MAG: two-component sensor histidine kinase [Neptuniibacter caesariensis]|uniref:histidine kinase n=1 Tax=Neptuniibacter caesariensis TaxID=207954 RepID=A0A2G6JPK8_NEPCE|nr:MAG: two-component sensor histidine kinase [Neptuniibacter caesariensis]